MPKVANFTPEEMQWQWSGRMGRVKPGEIVEMIDAQANHVLNQLGPRGLVRLEFGDEEQLEALKQQAVDTYHRFWIRQVTMHNRSNEMARNEGRPFTFPIKEVVSYAKKHGIELLQPWKMADPNTDKEKKLEEENAELKRRLQRLETIVLSMRPEDKELRNDLKNQYIRRGNPDFRKWVFSNLEEIKSWGQKCPPALDDLEEVWTRRFGTETPMPWLEDMDVEAEETDDDEEEAA